MVCHYSAMFGDHRYYGSGDTMFLIRGVILQDRVIKKSCAYIGRAPQGNSQTTCQVWKP